MGLSRREVIKAGVVLSMSPWLPLEGETMTGTSSQKTPFRLKYAPHFGMFRHHAGDDLVDQLKFAADEGFRAWEDNGMMGRSVQEQERLGKAMADLGIEMGVFVAHAEWRNPIYVRGGRETRLMLQDQMRRAVECAQRVRAKWCTVVPGPFDPGLEWGYQTANVIDCLKAMAEICEPAGLVMVLEPLNPWANHPGMFLTKIPQAYMICKAVNSPSCKILDDLYHQQITEGNLIPNLDKAWDEIAYIQVGDNPGRNEPTTGEINYRNVFKHLYQKGYKGIIGMEHGISKPGKEGERALIEAYRFCDSF
jgi:hydroxypyruvate isomerase